MSNILSSAVVVAVAPVVVTPVVVAVVRGVTDAQLSAKPAGGDRLLKADSACQQGLTQLLWVPGVPQAHRAVTRHFLGLSPPEAVEEP
jgi:hypothetical protein